MADIHALEIEFAKDPALDACIPLCEAYLGQKRFMEAMVVCKKGIKGSPSDPRGRSMLARVYLEQGKMPKAQQELATVMAEAPQHPAVLEIAGAVAMQQGDRDGAINFLQQAAQLDPNATRARELLGQLGVQVAVAAPSPTQPVAGQVPAQPGQMPPAQPMAGQPAPGQFPQPGQPGQPAMGQPFPGQQPPQQQPPQQQPPQQQPPQQSMPQMGAPGGIPAVAGTQPAFGGAMPPQQGIPGSVPGQVTQPGALPVDPGFQPGGFEQVPVAGQPVDPGVATDAAGKPLETVSDFFAPDTLGFATDDTSHIETAGPGRLTIVGFVPKNVGSIKTTIFVVLAVFVVAALFVGWQFVSAKNKREINRIYTDLQVAMDEDKYIRYKDAVGLAEQISLIDSENRQALSAAAYAQAVIATDHREEGALDEAKALFERAKSADGEKNRYFFGADALISFAEHRYEDGMASTEAFFGDGGFDTLVAMEDFRLRHGFRPSDPENKKALAKLRQAVSSEPRVFNQLGWYFYRQVGTSGRAEVDDLNDADKYFTSALQNSKGHPYALLGGALTDLDRGIGLKERQKEIDTNIKQVFSLPKDELSPPVLALAHFARAQLREWQEKGDEAEADLKKALSLDPGNATFNYQRGSSLLRLGDTKGAIEQLKEAAKKEPTRVAFYKRLAEAQMAARDPKAAKASLARAKELSPSDLDLKMLEGRVLQVEKNHDAAIKLYKTIKREDGTIPYTEAQIAIADAMRSANKNAQAVKHLEGYLSKAPDNIGRPAQARLLCELGLSLEANREERRAIQSYETGIEQYKPYPDCHYYLCRALGRGAEAKAACELYLTFAPRGEFVRDAKRRAR